MSDLKIKATDVTFIFKGHKYNIQWDGLQYVLTEYVPRIKEDAKTKFLENKFYFGWIRPLLEHLITIFPTKAQSKDIESFCKSISDSIASIKQLADDLDRRFPVMKLEIESKRK